MADQPLPDVTAPRPSTAVRRPVVALLANLVLPPLGHLYVGEAQRGFLLWLALQAVFALGVLSVILFPGPAPGLILAGAVIGTLTVLPIDTFLLARRTGADFRPRRYNRWQAYVAVGALMALWSVLWNGFHRAQVQAFRIPSASMGPTLLVGDFVLADKVTHRRQSPRRGDIVLIAMPQDPAEQYFKRIVGLPNEVIEIRDKQVFIDGEELTEPYAIHTDPAIRPGGDDPRDNLGPHQLGPQELFVMGDDRENSNDSRFWGPLPVRAVRGRAAVIYWSWDGSGGGPRWNRIGMRIK